MYVLHLGASVQTEENNKAVLVGGWPFLFLESKSFLWKLILKSSQLRKHKEKRNAVDQRNQYIV